MKSLRLSTCIPALLLLVDIVCETAESACNQRSQFNTLKYSEESHIGMKMQYLESFMTCSPVCGAFGSGPLAAAHTTSQYAVRFDIDESAQHSQDKQCNHSNSREQRRLSS